MAVIVVNFATVVGIHPQEPSLYEFILEKRSSNFQLQIQTNIFILTGTLWYTLRALGSHAQSQSDCSAALP
jgi:hypothetical protein